MIELCHKDISVSAQKVRFVRGEKAREWERHHLNLRAGDQQKPDYIESIVINEYLE